MADTLPEARQCTDPDDPMFGAVAVASDVQGVAWGVMTVRNGGHHVAEGSTEVDEWDPMKTATRARKPKPPPPAPPVPEEASQ